MRIVVLGAAGRTGRVTVAELLRRGHELVAVVRDPERAGLPGEVTLVVGDVRSAEVLEQAVPGADAVVSALGPGPDAPRLHGEVAPVLRAVMAKHNVRRYVGVSGAGLTVPGDRKSVRDRVFSALMSRLPMVLDKAAEYQVWAGSGIRWTLVRPPRLNDEPAEGRVEHHAHASPRRTALSRADLALFLVDVTEDDLYLEQAPLVAAR
ncbi:NmrA family transcriptional regulator [Lentzea pudingi]|uniref:NmrA family transcriptional regulator n=1 Tax=Lentzea pudingi TaxID=1789439 RepID=A0ABQ2HWG6_9PSEU|nr:NAD(P)H-binding protein [Lentzea pudingi]GGM93571.1 NmrA family transcriptional regulator [Lentzea pudingi]